MQAPLYFKLRRKLIIKKITITEDQKRKMKIGAALVASIAGGYFAIRMMSGTKVGEIVKASISKAMEHSLVEKNGFAYSYVIAVNEDVIPATVFKDIDTGIADVMIPYLEAMQK